MKNTFLSILWRQHKIGFIGALLFIIGQIFFTYKGVETVPFFNYGMYSSPISAQTSYTVAKLYQGEQQVPLSSITKAPSVLQYQLNYYHHLQQYQYIDPISKTIDQRFGKLPKFSIYLKEQLLTPKANLIHFETWLSQKYQVNFSIKKENFEWVNGHFKKVIHHE